MTVDSRRRVVVLGGAGFVGSLIAERLCDLDMAVHVIDGLLPGTGGSLSNLASFAERIAVTTEAVESIPNLRELLEPADVVVDAMAWTSHADALADPLYDLRLNLASHLHALPFLGSRHTVILLGSIGQYGSADGDELSEDEPTIPSDVQGIHKVAAEQHFLLSARRQGFRGASLRLPNTFGPGQKVAGTDIGLVGGFIRQLLRGEEVVVHGRRRSRSLAYGQDVADAVAKLIAEPGSDFETMNFAGTPVGIADLAGNLRAIAGSGSVRIEPLADDADRPQARLSDARLKRQIGQVTVTPLVQALRATVDYFRNAA